MPDVISYCNACARELGLPEGDLAEQTPLLDWLEGRATVVRCEGCGSIQCDPEGNCISDDCEKNHGLSWHPTPGRIQILAEDCDWDITQTKKGRPRVKCHHRPSGARTVDVSSVNQVFNKRRAFQKLAQTKKFLLWCRTVVDC